MEHQDKVNAEIIDVMEQLTQRILALEEKVSRIVKLVYKLVEDSDESL